MAVFKNDKGDFFLGVLYGKSGHRYSGNFLRFDEATYNDIKRSNYYLSTILIPLLTIPIVLRILDIIVGKNEFTQYLYCGDMVFLAMLAVAYFTILPRRLARNKVSLRQENLTCVVPISVSIYKNGGHIFLAIFLASLCSGAVAFGRQTLLFCVQIFAAIIFYYCSYRYASVKQAPLDDPD